jgi:hypothetical protein
MALSLLDTVGKGNTNATIRGSRAHILKKKALVIHPGVRLLLHSFPLGTGRCGAYAGTLPYTLTHRSTTTQTHYQRLGIRCWSFVCPIVVHVCWWHILIFHGMLQFRKPFTSVG